MVLHETIKRIRKDKGISQQQIALGYLSQSNYSKFENGTIEISAATFIGILSNLNMELEELLYINNNYEYSEREKIYRYFFRTPAKNKEELGDLILKCERFLENYTDQSVTFINKLCVILYKSLEKNEICINKNTAQDLLDEFKKKENLYIKDIYLINSIFFLFPTETAHLTMRYIETALKKYGDYQSINRMEVNLRLNYSLMLIKNCDENEALNQLIRTLPITKKYKLSIQMAILYIRLGICYNNLNIKTDLSFIKKGLSILETLDEVEVLNLMENEIQDYLK